MNNYNRRLERLEAVTERFKPDIMTVIMKDGERTVLPWNEALLKVLDGEVEAVSGSGACADLVEVMLQ